VTGWTAVVGAQRLAQSGAEVALHRRWVVEASPGGAEGSLLLAEVLLGMRERGLLLPCMCWHQLQGRCSGDTAGVRLTDVGHRNV
jgi:hypothetical protein